MPADAAPARPALTRRSLLRSGSYAVAAAMVGVPLSGCGIRVEPDSASLPFVPTRDAVPGEDVLLDVWAQTLALRDAALAVGGASTALPTVLAGLHSDQGQVLSDAMTRLGVPEDRQFAARTAALDSEPGSDTSTSTGTATGAPTGPDAPTGTSTSTGTDPSTGSGATTAATLGAAEAADVTTERISGSVAVPAALFPAVATLLAQRAAAAVLLGAPVAWPAPELPTPSAVQPVMDAVRSAAYGFEVVVAQAGDTRAELADSTLQTLRARVRSLSSAMGDAAAPPVAGYTLPFEVRTPDAAARLALLVLTTARTSLGATVADLRADADALGVALETLAETEVLASRWGLPLEAFPGLS